MAFGAPARVFEGGARDAEPVLLLAELGELAVDQSLPARRLRTVRSDELRDLGEREPDLA